MRLRGSGGGGGGWVDGACRCRRRSSGDCRNERLWGRRRGREEEGEKEEVGDGREGKGRLEYWRWGRGGGVPRAGAG